MRLNQTYTPSNQLNNLLITLEANKKALSLFNLSDKLKFNLRRRSLLHSAVYSARIENNLLTPESFIASSKSIEKLEIQNILDTLNWLYSTDPTPTLETKLIKGIHARIMHNLHSEAGQFRSEQSAVFNSAGVAIYLAPPAEGVKPLISSWIKQIKESSYPIPIQIAISHYQFEKIHPFIDGNGRAGRLLTTLLLKQHGLDLYGISNLEKYIENHLDGYYDYLAEEKRDVTHFVEYFLTAICATQNEALDKLKSGDLEQVKLFPRHQEIVEVIRDHPYATFDFLHRRFFAIPTSTLHYDLQQLQKQKLVERVRATRGATYIANR